MKKNNIYKFLVKLNNKISDNHHVTALSKSKNIFISKTHISKQMWKQNASFKPDGLWVSHKFKMNKQSWLDWCYDNNFLKWIDPCLNTYFSMDIRKCKMLKLNTKNKIIKFNKKYKAIKHGVVLIDWDKLSNKYDGVEFSPYFSEFKKDPEYMWYSAIDCSSSCVWNGQNIKNVKIVTLEMEINEDCE